MSWWAVGYAFAYGQCGENGFIGAPAGLPGGRAVGGCGAAATGWLPRRLLLFRAGCRVSPVPRMSRA